MPIETLPPYTGDAPSRDQEPSVFNTAMSYLMNYFVEFVAKLNLWTDQANALGEETTLNAISAASSAQVATAVVNSKGAWSNLIGTLSIPASVAHTNSTWLLNIDLADVALSEPTSVNTDWTEISGVTQAELDLKENITDNDIKLDLKENITDNDTKLDLKADQLTTYTKDEDDAITNTKISQDNTDQIKLGSFTVGESIAVTNWEYVGTLITLDVASHNAKIGDTSYVSDLVADIGDAPNGTQTVSAVTATSISYEVAVAPTATPDTGTTVNGALVKYGTLKPVGGFDLGQGFFNVTTLRADNINYPNDTGKEITIYLKTPSSASAITMYIDDVEIIRDDPVDATIRTLVLDVPNGSNYKAFNSGSSTWFEKR